jgi:2'-5' RNA ligase superfamily
MMSDDTERMRDHWWWRPGMRVGRRIYTWHFTFDGQAVLHQLVDAYQARLADLPGLDPVPRPWLHLTTQGIGFTDEVGDADIDAIIQESQERLATLLRVTVAMGPAVVTPEGILLQVQPAEGLTAVRRALRDAIAAVRGGDQLGEPDEWTPHVSVAYSNSSGPMEPYQRALNTPLEPVPVEIQDVRLIALGRDAHLYQWQTRAAVALA